ncbi:tail fiber domain-containing protein [Streptomyces sp. NPDC002499]
MIKRETLYGYLRDVDRRVGNGSWESIDNLLRCIAHLAEANGRPVAVDHRYWQRRWQRCEDRKASRWYEKRLGEEIEPRLSPDSWFGGWDGAADAVFAHESVREFTAWPPGQERLEALAQAVAGLGIADEPELAKEAAERLVAGATGELGGDDPRTLAARHSLAFWTGQAGYLRRAWTLTTELRADCRHGLGDDHILSRLAALREALWTGHMGRWHEANRLYAAVVRFEDTCSDPEPHIRLLARWGMARTGGRTGQWTHAYAELNDLLPFVTDLFGAGHPVALQAGGAHAWAVGRAGDSEKARHLLERLAERAENTLRPAHPSALWLRISLAYWTQQCARDTQSLSIVATAREQCESLLGRDHPLSIQAAEVAALLLVDADQEAAQAALSDVLERMERCYGRSHPFTLQAMSNYTAVRASIKGPAPYVGIFSDLADQLGRALGVEHPDTLRVRLNLVVAVLGTSGPQAAQSPCAEVATTFKMLLGEDHPDTLAAMELLEEIEVRAESERNLPTPPSQPYFRGFTGSGGGGGGGGEPSDRALKTRVSPIRWSTERNEGEDHLDHQRDGFEILAAVASLPVSTWSYQGEEDVWHLGPMAQDWNAAFGLGPDDRSIHLVDVNGVSLVAVQALHRLMRDLEAEVNALRARLEAGSED